MKSLGLLAALALAVLIIHPASAEVKKLYRGCAPTKGECEFSCESAHQCHGDEPNPALCSDARLPYPCFEWVPDAPARNYTHCAPVRSRCADCPDHRCDGDYNPQWCFAHGQVGEYACYRE